MRTHRALSKQHHQGLADVLKAYLDDAIRRSWCWGEVDCFLFVADWMVHAFGVDPAGAYRGAYDDQRAARVILRDAGGPVAFCDARMADVGWTRTDTFETGDVGLVRVALKPFHGRMLLVPAGAIYFGRGLWAMKPADGKSLSIAEFNPIAAWCPRRA